MNIFCLNKQFNVMPFSFIQKHLKNHQKVALLVVIESKGSSPGRQGFKMAIAPNGEMAGSIGGGKMEVRLVNEILNDLQAGTLQNRLIPQVHRSQVTNSSGMICSGEQTVLCFQMLPHHLPMLENEKGVLYFSLNEMWLGEGGYQGEEGGEGWLYAEVLAEKPQLYIVGGGHCALALSELARKLDFEIFLFDDRPQLNTIQKNEFAHHIQIIDDYTQIARYIPDGNQVFVVVMTIGFMSDEVVIRALFEKHFKYFGVLGSKAKIATLWKKLRLEGFDEAKLQQIHAPIGLPINSQTPMEIAISILAQIIGIVRSVRI
jgi:xanthine dehydrogenase accessory factor